MMSHTQGDFCLFYTRKRLNYEIMNIIKNNFSNMFFVFFTKSAVLKSYIVSAFFEQFFRIVPTFQGNEGIFRASSSVLAV